MKNRYTLSPLVHSDLAEIYKYIADYNLSAARRLMQSFRQRFQLLAENPLSGELRTDLADLIPNVRSVTVRGYVVFFRQKTASKFREFCTVRVIRALQ
jgi:plasmid stabilization system protein ParE